VRLFNRWLPTHGNLANVPGAKERTMSFSRKVIVPVERQVTLRSLLWIEVSDRGMRILGHLNPAQQLNASDALTIDDRVRAYERALQLDRDDMLVQQPDGQFVAVLADAVETTQQSVTVQIPLKPPDGKTSN
jgi:hypothetical protein